MPCNTFVLVFIKSEQKRVECCLTVLKQTNRFNSCAISISPIWYRVIHSLLFLLCVIKSILESICFQVTIFAHVFHHGAEETVRDTIAPLSLASIVAFAYFRVTAHVPMNGPVQTVPFIRRHLRLKPRVNEVYLVTVS